MLSKSFADQVCGSVAAGRRDVLCRPEAKVDIQLVELDGRRGSVGPLQRGVESGFVLVVPETDVDLERPAPKATPSEVRSGPTKPRSARNANARGASRQIVSIGVCDVASELMGCYTREYSAERGMSATSRYPRASIVTQS
jgi:hypothetical protein